MKRWVSFYDDRMNTTLRELHNWVDDFFDERSGISSRAGFPLDVEKTEESYRVSAELPGVDKKDISISYDDNVLTIGVESKESKESEERNFIHKERRSLSMSRSVYLADADREQISAKMEDGVLIIEAPLAKPLNTSKKIEIE
jgi:HSP20 family protein